jgi:hypothetical protein
VTRNGCTQRFNLAAYLIDAVTCNACAHNVSKKHPAAKAVCLKPKNRALFYRKKVGRKGNDSNR